jgi:putative membrane protein
MLAAGLVFTFAVCQLDPVRRRRSVAVRGATLLAAGAAHAVLAKTLYALPPPGTDFTAADLHSGVQWMYYGGDVVDAALAVVLGVGWYTAGGRARARRTRRGAAATGYKQRLTGAAGDSVAVGRAPLRRLPQSVRRGGEDDRGTSGGPPSVASSACSPCTRRLMRR